MATRIIKEGQKKFITTCSQCGCEFEYELEDIGAGNIVNCPCCGHICIHKNFGSPNNNGNIIYPYGPSEIPCNKDDDELDPWLKKPHIVYTTQQPTKSCKDCHVYQKMMKGEYTVDDSCFWCPNNPNKVTCGTGLATFDNTHTDSITNGTSKDIEEGKIKAYNYSK